MGAKTLISSSALWFTTGSAPSASIGNISSHRIFWPTDTYATDTSFWDGLSVSGFVNTASRGRVTGKASGIASAFASLQAVAFSNSAAQYW